MLKLNLGCGSDRRDGFTGVDRVKTSAADVVHNLDTGPWPFEDRSVEAIVAKDVFEHVNDPILFMTECWRILQHNGLLMIRTPHWKHRDAYTDPTHKRFPTEHTFDYWIRGTYLYSLHNEAYGGVAFALYSGISIAGGAMELMLEKIILPA